MNALVSFLMKPTILAKMRAKNEKVIELARSYDYLTLAAKLRKCSTCERPCQGIHLPIGSSVASPTEVGHLQQVRPAPESYPVWMRSLPQA